MSLRVRLAFAILFASFALFAAEVFSDAAACADVPGKEGFAAIGIPQLFPSAGVKLEPNDGAAVRMEGDVAVVDVAPERSFSGAKFVFGKPFAFIDCRTVSVEISNRTDRAMGNITWLKHTMSLMVPNWVWYTCSELDSSELCGSQHGGEI